MNSFMRESCAEDRSVAIYYDICRNVIIHWYGNPRKERESKGTAELRVENLAGGDNGKRESY